MTAYHSTDPRFYHPAGAEFTVSVYEVDTAIPLTTYADKDRSAMNPWPVVLEDDGVGNGYATIYIDAEFATIDLRDIDDVSVDGYPLVWVKPAQQDEVDAIDARLILNEATDIAQTAAIGIIQDDVEALDGRLTIAEGTIITHTGQIAALVIVDNALDGRLTIAEGTIITHTGQIAALVIVDNALDGRLTIAEGTIITHTGQIAALVIADGALDGRLTIAEGTIITHTGQIAALVIVDNALDDRLTIAEGTIITHTDDIDSLGDDVLALDGAVSAIDGRVTALELIDHAPPTGSSGEKTASFYDPTTHYLRQGGTGETASDGTATVTFPIPFTNSPVVSLTSAWGADYQHLTIINIEAITASSMTVRGGYVTSGSTVYEPAAIYFDWTAEGNKT